MKNRNVYNQVRANCVNPFWQRLSGVDSAYLGTNEGRIFPKMEYGITDSANWGYISYADVCLI